MNFGQNPPDPKNNGTNRILTQDQHKKAPGSFKILEQSEIPPQFTLEYYKNKQNGIERNLDDVLASLLPVLVTRNATRYKSDVQGYLQPHPLAYDALDIKGSLQTAYRPDPSQIGDYETYKKAASEMWFDDGQEKQLSRLTEAELKRYIKDRNEKVRKALDYYKEIELGKIPGLELKDMGGVSGIATKQKSKTTLRINIKVHPQDNPYVIIENLTKSFIEDSSVVKNGFRIKTLTGNTGARDGIIVYIPDSNFTGISKKVTDYFKDNFAYHDRHADPSIMFGTSLEAEDGSKFPSIRVVAEPPEEFMTYNQMQASLVSRATIAYIEKYFSGDKDRLIKAFRDNYFEAYLHFEQHFPQCYKASAKTVFGNDVSLSNLAFLGS